MQLRQTGNKIHSNSEMKSASFKIKASGKAFKILSSSLYSDKVTAIIRELSTNASDAHIANDNTDPFVVQLPNNDFPYFSVKDFGVGMSHDEIMSLYTTFFDSTKSESNDFTGALGLGSKSPFSYTDTFTVISIKDGKKGFYTAVLNESGEPQIIPLDTEDTDEPSGVEVQVPVKKYDISEFVTKAKSVFKYFPIKPIIRGVDDVTAADIVKEVSYVTMKNVGDMKYGFRDDNNYSRNVQAIMGNIAYPIDLSQINSELTSDFRGKSLDVFFQIGDLDINAGRESLSYDKLTILNIEKKLRHVKMWITSDLIQELASEPSEYNFRNKAVSFNKGDLRHFLPDLLDYNGKCFERSNLMYVTVPKHDMAGYSFSSIVKKVGRKTFDRSKNEHFHNYNRSEYHFSATEMVYFLDDLGGHGCLNRLKYLIETSGSNAEKFIISLEKDFYSYLTQEEVQEVLVGLLEKFLPGAPYVFASTLEERPKSERKKAKKVNGLLKLDTSFIETYTCGKQRHVTSVDYNDVIARNPGIKYYVRVNGFTPISDYGFSSSSELYTIKLIMKLFDKETVYFVRNSVYNIIKDDKKWVDAVEEYKKAHNKYKQKLVDVRFVQNIETNAFKNFPFDINFVQNQTNTNKNIKELIAPIVNLGKNSLTTIESVLYNNSSRGNFGLRGYGYYDLPNPSESLVNLEQEIKTSVCNFLNKYPMVKHCDGSHDSWDDVVEYTK